MPLRGIILLAVFVGSLPVCFCRPLYGVCLWLIVAFLNPQSYTWGAATVFPWAVAVAIPTLAGLVFFNSRHWGRLASLETVLIVVLWCWFTTTSVISTHTPLFVHHAADTWFRWGVVSKILLMAVAMIPIVTDFTRLRIVVVTIATCFGVFVAKILPFILTSGGQYRIYGPPNSMIADNNDFGLALNMTLPLFFFLAQTEPRRWVRRAFAVLFVITIPAILFTYSRGATLGVIVLLLLMVLRLKQRWVLIPVIACGVLFALAFAPDAWKNRMDPTRKDAIDTSAKSRFTAWTFAYNLASDYPLTGGGFATFTPELFTMYAPSMDIHGAHSIYFQVLGEHGYTGLLFYLALVSVLFLDAARLIKRARARDDTEIELYANMFRFSLVGFLVPGCFLGRAYFDYFFTIVACLAILKKIAADRWAKADEGGDSDDEHMATIAA
jgi:probable O-glycosylation ligase (exosortase A-associated)